MWHVHPVTLLTRGCRALFENTPLWQKNQVPKNYLFIRAWNCLVELEKISTKDED